jgi:type II secretory pathway pseudopilin PulG
MPVPKRKVSGFTLIETLISIGVLSIFIVAIAMILRNVLEYLARTRIRSTALAIAQQKMETVRNLPYASLGTIGGIPAGTIVSTENITVNNQVFSVAISVVYIDDPYDGIAPSDVINTDYKRARISVTWGGTYPSVTPITLVTDVSPKTAESTPSGGTIMVRIYNSFGQPVSGARVTVDNTSIIPPIHTNDLTDTSGIVIIPGAPPCNTCYRISVTKNGYSSDRTYATSEVTNPIAPDSSVLESQLTQLSLSIDAVSSLTVNSYSAAYAPVANVQFTLRGSKIIGYDSSDLPVYKYSYTTNTGGFTVSIPNLEWDNYDLDLTNSSYTLAGSNPMLPLPLASNTQVTLPIVVVPKSQASLLVVARDALGSPLASASARVKSTTLGYDTTAFTQSTGSADFGHAMFNNLAIGAYDLSLTAPGYTEATASVNITGNQRQTMTIQTL